MNTAILLTQLSILLDGELCIVNADCETDSICSNFVCTSSVGTQTTSKRNASVQTSIESLSDVPFKSGKSYSNKRTRNYIKYNKLDNSDATKFSFDDESTQCKG